MKRIITLFLCLVLLTAIPGEYAFGDGVTAETFKKEYYRLPGGTAIYTDKSLETKAGVLSEDAIVYATACKSGKATILWTDGKSEQKGYVSVKKLQTLSKKQKKAYLKKAADTVTSGGIRLIRVKFKKAAKKPNEIRAVSGITAEASTKAQKFSLGASALGGAKLTYQATDPLIRIDETGTVRIPGKYVGETVITVTAEATGEYKEATLEIPVTVSRISNRIKAQNITLTASGEEQTAELGATCQGGAKLTYKSDNDKIRVNKKGVITVAAGYTGKGYITVTAAEASIYAKTKKKIRVTVKAAEETPTPEPTATPAPAEPMTLESLTVIDYRTEFGQSVKWEDPELYPGQILKPELDMKPETADLPLSWKSSDNKVAKVDELGNVTVQGPGKATITVSAENGVSGEFLINVRNGEAKLTYKKNDTGYTVTGCDPEARTVRIPATYEGLPVNKISGKAFIDCAYLLSFTVEEGQETFRARDGVLFRKDDDSLVRFPNAYGNRSGSYTVPSGTKVIREYAFAGITKMVYLYLPEGVKTVEDHAFAEAHWQYFVYMPDSLTDIGENLLQGQTSNVPFYGHNGTAIQQYAYAHQIPFGIISPRDPDQQTADETDPEQDQQPGGEGVDESGIIRVPTTANGYYMSNDNWDLLRVTYDLSEYEAKNPTEVRLMTESQWWHILPDANGNTKLNFPAQTGLYGIGYAKQEATLRGYDLQGNVVAVKTVKGNFALSMPGACNIGVSGGNGTTLTLIPYKPIFISSAGNVPLDAGKAHMTKDGKGLLFYAVLYPRATFNIAFPDYLNICPHSICDAVGKDCNSSYSNRYTLISLCVNDPNRMNEINLISLRFDGLDILYSDDGLEVNAKKSFGLTKEDGQLLSRYLSDVRSAMIGTYYPADAPVRKITVSISGRYPYAWQSCIEADELCLPVRDNAYTFTHEMIHAVDQSLTEPLNYMPAPWMEGRAEYIGELVTHNPPYYATGYDWSVLSEEDKADFCHYYCTGTNVNTQYPVGYFFIKYITGRFGASVNAKIMSDFRKNGVRNEAEFKAIVEAETEPDIFQHFVRDVINK